MPPKQVQGTIIILDVGRNASTADEKNQKTFFELAKECTSRIIERKIMSQGNNLVGILLLGSTKTENNMAMQSGPAFKHIQLHTELQEPSWQMIRNLPRAGSTSRGDWIDALLVAADYYKNVVSGIKLSERKIILMTNFQKRTSLDKDAITQVLEGFKEDNFEVDVIGPDIYSEEEQKNLEFKIASQFVELTDGATATFEQAMGYLLFHKKKATNPSHWDVNLAIGPNIKIPVSSFIRIKDEPPVKKWVQTVKDPITSSASTSEAIVKKKEFVNPENQTVVEKANKMTGHNYGHKIIPFSECDKTLLYESGEKSLTVYGFTDAKNIGWQNFDPDGLSYVFARKGDKKAQLAIRCLVECLHELNLVGIVRKVHNNNNAPKMFALMPVIDSNNFVCLSMAVLCYKDDVKQMAFPPTNLKKYNCSNDQVDAFKELIVAMDLTKAYDDTFDDAEAFPISETVSPSVQYILDSIAYRALNPGKPLPKPREDIMSLFKVPPTIEKRAKDPLEKLKKLLVLNKVEAKPKRGIKNDALMDVDESNQPSVGDGALSDMPNMSKIILPTIKSSDAIDNIGTINPTGDFKVLKDKGKSLEALTPEMVKAIESLVYSNIDGDFTKALDSMLLLRTEYMKDDANVYNKWLQRFKEELNERKKNNVINLIREKKVDIILKEENSRSTYDNADNHDDSQLYDNNTVPDSTELTIRSEINDMFDEM